MAKSCERAVKTRVRFFRERARRLRKRDNCDAECRRILSFVNQDLKDAEHYVSGGTKAPCRMGIHRLTRAASRLGKAEGRATR